MNLFHYWDRHRPVRSTRNQLLEYIDNRLIWNHLISHAHPYRHCPHTATQTRVGHWKESQHTWNSCSANNGENTEFRFKRNAATTLAARSCIALPTIMLPHLEHPLLQDALVGIPAKVTLLTCSLLQLHHRRLIS